MSICKQLKIKQVASLLSVSQDWVYRKIWIITEADRSVTTILFPDEY